ncbi:MAG: hypothetical protein MR591_04950 [Helicobacter sp.]|uniref:HipA family kinase n=1 Tax=unclassified Helicobacter TaxID=2593540 RepID=UPI000DCEA2FD|nr:MULTISPECIES: HipA family kinase [unclassified Helicobacter]MCI6313118.1 hypothetical protein [Helicobacter sp.]MCI7765454.1 hypothetical protein [Helicobacter sp.]RAX52533.1 hypothetical protein CCY98_04050 [Helicobacter sp. 11-8110]
MENIETRDIDRIIKVMDYGVTYPILIVANNDKQYILKTRQVLDGTSVCAKNLFIEIFSYLYLDLLRVVNIPKICLLNITDETLLMVNKFQNGSEREQQAYHNIHNSKGLNLGIEFIPNTSKFKNKNDKAFIKNTINYDARLMNTDRDEKNPNILVDCKNKKWLIDFGLAFDCMELLDNLHSPNKLKLNMPNELYYSKCCFSDYIFDDYRKTTAILNKKVQKQEIQNIMSLIPSEWYPIDTEELGMLCEIISQRQSHKEILYASGL